MDYFCVYLASNFPLAAPAVCLNWEQKSNFGFIIFDKHFTLNSNTTKHVVLTFVWLVLILFAQKVNFLGLMCFVYYFYVFLSILFKNICGNFELTGKLQGSLEDTWNYWRQQLLRLEFKRKLWTPLLIVALFRKYKFYICITLIVKYVLHHHPKLTFWLTAQVEW